MINEFLEPIKHKQYNYMVTKQITRKVNYYPLEPIKHAYFSLTLDGIATIEPGYMIDGCSGAAIDGKKNIIPCLWHDLGFQLLREGLIPASYFDLVNELFYQDLIEAGFNKIRAFAYFKAVSWFGKKYAKPNK